MRSLKTSLRGTALASDDVGHPAELADEIVVARSGAGEQRRGADRHVGVVVAAEQRRGRHGGGVEGELGAGGIDGGTRQAVAGKGGGEGAAEGVGVGADGWERLVLGRVQVVLL